MTNNNKEYEEYKEKTDNLAKKLQEIHDRQWFINDETRDEKKFEEMTTEELESGKWSYLMFSDYIYEALDVELRIGLNGEYRSAYICLGTGGPEIGIDTGTGEAICFGWFGLNKATTKLSNEVINEIDESIEYIR